MMNKSQRKLHVRMWMILLVVIPVGFVSALVVIPEDSAQDNVFLASEPRLDLIVEKHNTDNAIVLLRSSQQKEKYQIEVVITTPFTQPEVGVYSSKGNTFDINESKWLGSLSTKRTNLFSLRKQVVHKQDLTLVFYDPIRKQILEEIQFEL